VAVAGPVAHQAGGAEVHPAAVGGSGLGNSLKGQQQNSRTATNEHFFTCDTY